MTGHQVIFDIETINRLVDIARTRDPIIRPLTDDCGHQFYFFWLERERMIDNLPVGWTYQVHPAGGGHFCLYDPRPIEELDNDRREIVAAYWYDED